MSVLFPSPLFPAPPWFFGGAVPVPGPTPIGTGATLVAAIEDAFVNAATLGDFEGRIVFDRDLPNRPFPYCEVYELDTTTVFDSGDTYVDYVDLQFSIWDEDALQTQLRGEAVRDLFDFCYLTFDDGDLIEFRRLTSRLVRHPKGFSRGEHRQFEYVIAYRVMVNRTLP